MIKTFYQLAFFVPFLFTCVYAEWSVFISGSESGYSKKLTPEGIYLYDPKGEGILSSQPVAISKDSDFFIYNTANGLTKQSILTGEKKILRPVLSAEDYYEKYLTNLEVPDNLFKEGREYPVGVEKYFWLTQYPEDPEEIGHISLSPNDQKLLIISHFAEAEEIFFCVHEISNFENVECNYMSSALVGVLTPDITNEGLMFFEDKYDQYMLENLIPDHTKKVELLFSDLRNIHPLYNDVIQAVEDGWISGYPDNTVRLEAPVNRAEFSKMLIAAFDQEQDALDAFISNFPDLEAGAWYRPFLAQAVKLGLMKGYPDGTMKPANAINVAEAFKMAVTMGGQPLTETEGPWYEKYRMFVVENISLTSLDTTNPNLDAAMNRGQCIELISRLKSL